MSTSGFEETRLGYVTLVTLGREFETIYQAELSLLDDIVNLARTIDPPQLVVDISTVEYFGSAFIGLLIRLCEIIEAREGGRFAVSSPTSFGEMALKSTKVTEIFKVHGSTDDAVKSMHKPI